MQKLSNKQKPQLIMLIVLSVVVFGYFSFRMITPTPAAAHSQIAAVAPVAIKTASANVSTPAEGSAGTDTTDPSPTSSDAPPPSPTMRDPFIPGILDPGTVAAYNNARKSAAEAAKPQGAQRQTATHSDGPSSLPGIGANVPPAPPVPGPGNLSAALPSGNAGGPSSIGVLPVPAPAPAWSVTGVLRSGSDEVAILRNGAARRIVKAGDEVDSQYRIVSVNRQSVVLRHGQQTVTLPLGGAQAQTGSKGSHPGIPSPDAASAQGLAPLQGAPQVQGPVH